MISKPTSNLLQKKPMQEVLDFHRAFVGIAPDVDMTDNDFFCLICPALLEESE